MKYTFTEEEKKFFDNLSPSDIKEMDDKLRRTLFMPSDLPAEKQSKRVLDFASNHAWGTFYVEYLKDGKVTDSMEVLDMRNGHKECINQFDVYGDNRTVRGVTAEGLVDAHMNEPLSSNRENSVAAYKAYKDEKERIAHVEKECISLGETFSSRKLDFDYDEERSEFNSLISDVARAYDLQLMSGGKALRAVPVELDNMTFYRGDEFLATRLVNHAYNYDHYDMADNYNTYEDAYDDVVSHINDPEYLKESFKTLCEQYEEAHDEVSVFAYDIADIDCKYAIKNSDFYEERATRPMTKNINRSQQVDAELGGISGADTSDGPKFAE